MCLNGASHRTAILALSAALLGVMIVPLSPLPAVGVAHAMAVTWRAQDGAIDIEQARLVRREGRWNLQAKADVELPVAVRAGLDSGVPLTFNINFRLLRPRYAWWPETLFEYQQSYTVVYYELTRHYRLQADGANTSRNYRSLLAALEALGELEMALPTGSVPAMAALPTDLQGRLQIRLDRSALPLPLQSMLSRSWRLASREYVWPLN